LGEPGSAGSGQHQQPREHQQPRGQTSFSSNDFTEATDVASAADGPTASQDQDDVAPPVPRRTSSKQASINFSNTAYKNCQQLPQTAHQTKFSSATQSASSGGVVKTVTGHFSSTGNGVANQSYHQLLQQQQQTQQQPTRSGSRSVHYRNSGAGATSTLDSGLQWSSESTLGASELVRRHRAAAAAATANQSSGPSAASAAATAANAHAHHQIHHHHYYHHHPAGEGGSRGASLTHQRSLSSAGTGSGRGSRASGTISGRPGTTTSAHQRALQHMHAKDDLMITEQLRKHRREHQRHLAAGQESLSDSEEGHDVCMYCSDWLTKTLLCSCQVPSSSTNSSPSGGGGGQQQANFGNSNGKGIPRPASNQR